MFIRIFRARFQEPQTHPTRPNTVATVVRESNIVNLPLQMIIQQRRKRRPMPPPDPHSTSTAATNASTAAPDAAALPSRAALPPAAPLANVEPPVLCACATW